MEDHVNRTIESLEKNGFPVKLFETKEEALMEMLQNIPMNESVGMGGSITLEEIGIYDALLERKGQVYWHQKCPLEEKAETLKKAASADIYLSGINALTEDGKIVNIDGTGNRVANIFWGHKKIILVCGINKITKDHEKAIERIKNVASPKNTKRLNKDTPCRYTGKCQDCDSPDRICRIEVVLEKQPLNGKVEVYLIKEELGY